MLWYKSWLDTRARFLLALVVLLVFACGTVIGFPKVRELVTAVEPAAVTADASLRQELEEQREAIRTFRGYAWSQWFAGNFPTLLVLVAAMLGSGSPLRKSGSGALFLLALPVSRARWIGARAGVGVVELFVVALGPSLLLVALAPFVGEQLQLSEAIVYGLSTFVGASLFFSVAMFWSTLFNDVWWPLLFTCFVWIAAVAIGAVLPEGRGIFAAMMGETYFHDGTLPWPELLLCAAAAPALVYAAAANVARRDF